MDELLLRWVDIYLGRLIRTLSVVDIQEALQWCEEISNQKVKLMSSLQSLLNSRTQLSQTVLESEINRISTFAQQQNLNSENLSPAKFELEELAMTRSYPDYPAERWEDLIAEADISYQSP